MVPQSQQRSRSAFNSPLTGFANPASIHFVVATEHSFLSRAHPIAPWHPQIFVLNASSLLDVVSQKWFAYQRHDEILTSAALSGSHPGCVENRQEFGRHCEFDGRLSVVQHRSRFLIFARANLKASGGRFVQVATSRADDPSSSGYGPFKLLNIAGYDPLGPGAKL